VVAGYKHSSPHLHPHGARVARVRFPSPCPHFLSSVKKKRNVGPPPLMLPIPPRAWDPSPTRAAASPAAAAMAAGRGLLVDCRSAGTVGGGGGPAPSGDGHRCAGASRPHPHAGASRPLLQRGCRASTPTRRGHIGSSVRHSLSVLRGLGLPHRGFRSSRRSTTVEDQRGLARNAVAKCATHRA
jgi:hypothetical protein